MFLDFCVILYLGKATAKLHVVAHQAERREKNKTFWCGNLWEGKLQPFRSHVCVYLTSVLCVESGDLFYSSVSTRLTSSS